MNFECLNGRVLVELIYEDEVSPGGIYIPEQAKERPVRGRVVALGEGYYLESGEYVKTRLKVGDVVYFGRYAGSEIKIDGHDYNIIIEQDVFGREAR